MSVLLAGILFLLPPPMTGSPDETSPAKPPKPDLRSDTWPLWLAFKDHFITEDGRVVDHTDGARTVSEGQAYGLFFSLVANDRETFDSVLDWTQANLAKGNLATHLPAWVWGRTDKGKWKILDSNPASDADMWIAYSLLEAGRLWDEPRYTNLGRAVVRLIARHEVAELPGRGPVVLPAPHGFVLEADKRWRLNPSYLPLQVIERFAQEDPDGPWTSMRSVTVGLLAEACPHGFAPDWVEFSADRGYVPDPVKGPVGSYDAIRTYLWAEMLPADSPWRERVGTAVSGMYMTWAERGRLPEIINTQQPDSRSGRAPVGYFAAILPQAARWGGADTAARVERQIEAFRRGALYGDPPRYYDHCLLLFGTGFREGRYCFAANGNLKLQWKDSCSSQ